MLKSARSQRILTLAIAAVMAATLLVVPDSATAAPVFLRRCGLWLCVGGKPYNIHGGTTYGQISTLTKATAEGDLAVTAKLNTIEVLEFETKYHSLSATMTEATWTRVDDIISVARARGLRVILNLSSYGQSLFASGKNAMTTDWKPYLQFVTQRVNTVTGVKYADDPTIAMVELWGEVPAPNYGGQHGTTAQTTAFFKRSLAELRALDSNHLISTGGFSYINDPKSGIDWKTIVADPNNDVCGVEINSTNDRDISVPNLSSYCKSIGKGWFLSAWSSCLAAKSRPSDIDHWPNGDPDMATHATNMYQVERGLVPGSSLAAVGSDFWNLAPSGSCDIGPTYPKTLAVVQSYAPKP